MNEQRIEGSGVDPELDEGLAAPVADPLWLLARQWQVGEFQGEDAAQPVVVEALVDSYIVTGFLVPGGKGQAVGRSKDGVPLEALAERETRIGDANPFASGEAGLSLIRQLRGAGLSDKIIEQLRLAFPLPASDGTDGAFDDALGRARMAMMIEGSLDADTLLSVVLDGGVDVALKAAESAAGPDIDELRDLLERWAETEKHQEVRLGIDEAGAWRDREQDYRFGISAETETGAIELRAPSYPGGRLDWYDFELHSLPETLPESHRQQLRSLVSPLRFAGQPADRWWEMEEGDTYFGDLAGGPDDLARSAIASYAAVAGDDWFVLPARIPTGSVAKVDTLRVFDNFSKQPTTIEPAAHLDIQNSKGDRPWRWFELSHPERLSKNATRLLFVPPTINSTEEGRPLERVEFRRDELGNMAWCIEHTVEGASGIGVNWSIAPEQPAAANPDGVWTFELGQAVPPNWHPLVPVRIEADDPAVVLRRGVIARSDNIVPTPPMGRILTPGQPFLLNEAELPAGGLRVVRRYQSARDGEGRLHLWIGRRKRPSAGPEQRSPLEFDKLTGWAPKRSGGNI